MALGERNFNMARRERADRIPNNPTKINTKANPNAANTGAAEPFDNYLVNVAERRKYSIINVQRSIFN